MKRVTILAMPNTMASTITGPMDIFYQAGVMFNYLTGKKITPHFDLRLVTATGSPFKCLNGVRMHPDGAISNAVQSDLVIVSSTLDIDTVLQKEKQVIPWLANQYEAGAHIAALCSGTFVLAETGLLDGKTATTHWAYADEFVRRYPGVRLKPEHLITDEGDLFCSGGFAAGIDLSLYLVEKYCGRRVALESSKSAVFEIGRDSQSPFAVFQFQKKHTDPKVRLIQEWIETHFATHFDYDQLAEKFHMGKRTLERRFKKATGDTPLQYLQRVRVEVSKQQLESGDHSFDEITANVGYENSSSFRKVFIAHTGMRPSEYKHMFRLRK